MMLLRRIKITVFAVIIALIMQSVAVSGNAVLELEQKPNNDFEYLTGDIPSAWNATNAVISSDNTFWHSGKYSLKIVKSDTDESTVSSNALSKIEKQNTDGDITLSFGLWYKAQNCNVFMRLDAVIYDSDKKQIDTLTGNTVMLPRSEKLCEWTEITTNEKVAENAAYISYQIVLTGVNSVAVGDKATVYVDDITCTATEAYGECVSDFCDFHSLTETCEVSGWSVTDGNFTTSNGIGLFKGTSNNSKISYKTEKLLPECNYQIKAKYTSSNIGTVEISYYDYNGNILKTDSVTLASSQAESTLLLETYTADAVYAVFSIIGCTEMALDDLYFFKTSTRENASFSGWTADSLWYPEDAATQAFYQYRYFRVTFQLDYSVRDAYVQMAYDDNIYGLTVNGISVSTKPFKTVSQDGKSDVRIFNLGSFLSSGKNVIAVKILNCTQSAGFMLESYIHTANNQTYHLTANQLNTRVSRLNCESSHENDYASFKEFPSDWNTEYYDDSLWKIPIKQGIPPYSNFGSGDVSFAFEYSDYFSFLPSLCPTVTAIGGEEKTTSIKINSFKNSNLPKTVTGLVYSDNSLKAHIPLNVSLSGNTVNFSYKIPDYLSSGNYYVKPYGIGLLGNSNILFNLIINHKQKVNPAVCTVKENGSVKLKINNDTVSPVMYMRPSNSEAYYNYLPLSTFENSGISLYCTFNGYLNGSDGDMIWKGANQIDYDAFDSQIYKTLDLNKDAYLIINLALDAPDWWMAENVGECQTDAYGNVLDKVSFASVKYREEASKIIELLVGHMEQSAYSHRVIGVKLTAGKTNEWMNYLRNDDDTLFYSVDYSLPMQNAFKNATGYDIPPINKRAESNGSLILDRVQKADVIAYNEFLSQCVTDSFLCYAKAVKSTAPNIIVGGYNGYLWFENSSLGIGTSHATVEQVLSSEFVDFISSPVNYAERINGFATGYMALTDSVTSHGKLYIAEQDNRTIYGHIFGDAESDNKVGYCGTLNESVNQIVRDLSTNLISGNGFWLFDMEGGWFDDGQIKSVVKKLKTEYDYSSVLNMASNSEIAVFVGPDNYDYLNSDIYLDAGSKSTRLLSQLYNAQRLELSKIGTSYDTYSLSDLTSTNVNVDWTQYKLIIMLSPFKVNSQERSAIENKLKRDGKYILWVYLPGISNGITSSADNISSLVDMDVSVESNSNNLLYAEITDSNYSSGRFGTTTPYNAPRAVIKGEYDGVVAKYPSNFSFLKKNAMAYKFCNNYTSVYSAVPGVPASALRKLCKMAGVNIYSDNLDVTIQTNSSYISVNSAYSGQQTLQLYENYKVFDVLNECTVSESTNKIDVFIKAGETKLYRLEKSVDSRNYDGGILTNGDFYLKSKEGKYADWSLYGTSSENPNLVINGDFENSESFYGWSAYSQGSASVNVTDEEDKDNSVAKIHLSADDGQGYIQGFQFNVKPSTEYSVSYRLKIDWPLSGGNGAQCYSLFYQFNENQEASGGLVAESGRWNTENSGWQTVTYNITTDAQTKTARLDLMHNAVAGTSYWDDVRCVETEHTSESEPVLIKSSLIDNAVSISGNGCGIGCPTLASDANSSYILSFDGCIQNSGKAVITVFRSDKLIKIKSSELSLDDKISNCRIAIPSTDAESFYLKITLKDANENSSLHIGNITMKKNYGDLNFDGLVSAKDFVLMRKFLLNAEKGNEFFDLNGDCIINLLDFVRLKRYSVMANDNK